MYESKLFLSKLLALEGVSVEELMALTGRSRSVVYEWLNLADKESFPPFASLEKILCRLGITLDDLFACHHPLYGDGSAARRYGQYTVGAYENAAITEALLEENDADAIVSTYLNDRRRFAELLTEARSGEVDTEEFDLYAEALKPVLVTELGGELPQACYLNSATLPKYRLGCQTLVENGEEPENDEHYVAYPDPSAVILLASRHDVRHLDAYLHLADEKEKSRILACYIELRGKKEKLDRKNRLLRSLLREECALGEGDSEKLYRQLLVMLVQ